MKSLMKALGAMLVLCAACKPLVLNGGGSAGAGGETTQGNSGMGGASEVPSALSMRLADLPADALAVVTSQGGGQVPTDPETLVLIFTSTSETCAAPLVDVADLSCDVPPFWELALFIPPALQGSGPIDLMSPEAFFYAAERLSGSGGSCGSGEGAGPGKQGTLTIDSTDPSALRLTLSGGVTALGTTIDGVYTASSCP